MFILHFNFNINMIKNYRIYIYTHQRTNVLLTLEFQIAATIKPKLPTYATYLVSNINMSNNIRRELIAPTINGLYVNFFFLAYKETKEKPIIPKVKKFKNGRKSTSETPTAPKNELKVLTAIALQAPP